MAYIVSVATFQLEFNIQYQNEDGVVESKTENRTKHFTNWFIATLVARTNEI